MKKVYKSLLAIVMLVSGNSIAQYPSSFSWNAASGEDQKIQGPCHIFASVSTVETWYRLLYGSTPGISQAHLFSQCAGADPVTTTIQSALTFFKDVGVVDDNFLPYANSNNCTVNAGTALNCTNTGQVPSYFHAQLYPANTNALINCSLPYSNCTSGNSLPDYHYRIGGFQELNIAGFTTTDQLKRAIMNYGPIALWMRDPSLHGNTNHAYSLYGWNSNGSWLLTDSWPCSPGTTQTSLNIVSLFQQGLGFKAFILTTGATKPAVYREQRSGTSWIDNALVPSCPDVSYSTAFTISGADVIASSATTYTVNNLGLLDNPTVEWSFVSTNGAAVSYSSNVGTSFTVTGTTGGTGEIKAKIKRPNGLCETIKKTVSVVLTIPFTYTKTQDQCIGNVRRITYQVTSPYPINCVWDFRPSPGSSYTTSISGCTFTVNYTTFNKSYGLLVRITSPSFPGQTDGATAGGPVMPCGGGFAKSSVQSQQIIQKKDGTLVSIYPNPAHSTLNIMLPQQNEYIVSITDVLGNIVLKRKATGNIQLNTAKFSAGIYVVRISKEDGSGHAVIKKIIIQ